MGDRGFLRITSAIAILAIVSLHPRAASAAFMIDAYSAVYSPTTGIVDFRLQFSQPPDLLTLDAYGRATNGFQYYITGDRSLPYPDKYDSIVRGLEPRTSTTSVLIRNSGPSDPNPAAGGWGTIRDAVPFSLVGDVLTFSAPLTTLTTHNADGIFSYDLGSFVYGAEIDYLSGVSTISSRPIPELGGIYPLASGLVGLGFLLASRRRAISIPDELTGRT